MVNSINEKIYDYIFSVNENQKHNIVEDFEKNKQELDNIIKEVYEIPADFWDESLTDFNKKCVLRVTSIDQDYPEYIYNNFPRMNSSCKISYLEFKKEMIKNSIENNGDFIKDEIAKKLSNIDNLGKKAILDYCEKSGLIKYKGKVYMAADDNPAYAIIYENIEANIIKESASKKEKEDFFVTGYLIQYNIKEVLIDSTNATLYIVTDESGKEYVAKLIHKEISTEKRIRFKNEINFGKKYRSENILEIMDNGLKPVDGKLCMFYVMPKYHCDLRKMMNDKMEVDNLLKYFNQILEGVKFIHNKRCFHRDLKPENILYDKEKNNLVIADMGIAHFNEDELIDNPKTKLKDKMANFAYAAPEQRVKGKVVDYRCDIYALGLILYELYMGELIGGTKYKPISQMYPKYNFLDEIVEKMISQNPDDRYSSIDEIQYDISVGIITSKLAEEIKQKSIEISNEEDILVSRPVKVIDVRLEKDKPGTRKFTIILSENINDMWVEIINSVDKKEVSGFGVENFNIFDNKAVIKFPERLMDSLPRVTEYFKQWIESTNKIYPKRAKEKEEYDRMIREKEIKIEKEKKEKEIEVLKKIKI